MAPGVRVRCLQQLGEREIQGLAQVLIDCVEGGASVSFMLPMTWEKAEGFWRNCAASAARGERVVLVAEEADGAVLGTVTLVTAQPENQPHRADVAKMLVHRSARGRGIGAALLDAVERCAQDAGKSVLVLDTVTGTAAERLYQRQGWQRCGEIPDYALWPGGGLCPTTVYYKRVARP